MTSQQPQKRPRETLSFSASDAALITPYLPPSTLPSPLPSTSSHSKPNVHVTLTYAHSLDACIAAAPGVRTILSGPQSKAMTHFLRAHHDAILVGAGTAVADDPGLNSRLRRDCLNGLSDVSDGNEAKGEGWLPLERQPRPIILDPRARWAVHEGSKAIRVAREGKGKAPWVFVDSAQAQNGGRRVVEERRKFLEQLGGQVIELETKGKDGRFAWEDVLAVLEKEGIRSVMIEGGGEVIRSLLVPPDNRFVHSVIVTIAPTWLGQGGIMVSPPRAVHPDGMLAMPVRLTDVKWCPMGEDVVLCGRFLR